MQLEVLDLLVVQVRLVELEPQVEQEQLEVLVEQDQQVPQALLEALVPQEAQVRLEELVPLVVLVPQGPQA